MTRYDYELDLEAWNKSIGTFQNPDSFLLAAMREVDDMTPGSTPLFPEHLLVPITITAHASQDPGCLGPGGCGYFHPRGVTCGQALLNRYIKPTPAPGPGQPYSM